MWAGLACIALLSSCGFADRDDTGRDAFIVDARLREALDDEADHEGTYVEPGRSSVHGDTNGLDYSIGTA